VVKNMVHWPWHELVHCILCQALVANTPRRSLVAVEDVLPDGQFEILIAVSCLFLSFRPFKELVPLICLRRVSTSHCDTSNRRHSIPC